MKGLTIHASTLLKNYYIIIHTLFIAMYSKYCQFETNIHFSGGKFYFDQFTTNKISFSGTLISHNYAQSLP